MISKEKKLVFSLLEKLQVSNNSVLLVHSAFSNLSRNGYKAEDFIKAMVDYLNNGTLLMPTMTWRTVTPNNPVWDEAGTPSHTGILSEIFRTEFSTHRSLHPTHSVAGLGGAAEYLLSGHHLGTTPVPASSPYGLMRDYNAYILLIGVGFEMCTAIHHPEEMIVEDIYVKPLSACENYTLITRAGKRLDYKLRRHKKLNRNFEKYRPPHETSLLYHASIYDNTPISLIKMAPLLQNVFQSLIENPLATTF